MGQSIAVMNTKGGVGKSTLVMALAETLSLHHGKTVLVIDSDAQTSISIMMCDMARWEEMERDRRTLVEYLAQRVLADAAADWKSHVVSSVSDVDDAANIFLMPSHMNLTLFEREVSAERKHTELRTVIRTLLAEAAHYFDVVLIDCPPGLSVLTECWLREATFYLPPTKADYLAVRGLDILKRFRDVSTKHGFADLLGVLVNQKDEASVSEAQWHQRLIDDPAHRCFPIAVPRRAYLQRAADFDPQMRTFSAKYPGDAGRAIRDVVDVMLARMALIAQERRSWTGERAGLEALLNERIAAATSGNAPLDAPSSTMGRPLAAAATGGTTEATNGSYGGSHGQMGAPASAPATADGMAPPVTGMTSPNLAPPPAQPTAPSAAFTAPLIPTAPSVPAVAPVQDTAPTDTAVPDDAKPGQGDGSDAQPSWHEAPVAEPGAIPVEDQAHSGEGVAAAHPASQDAVEPSGSGDAQDEPEVEPAGGIAPSPETLSILSQTRSLIGAGAEDDSFAPPPSAEDADMPVNGDASFDDGTQSTNAPASQAQDGSTWAANGQNGTQAASPPPPPPLPMTTSGQSATWGEPNENPGKDRDEGSANSGGST